MNPIIARLLPLVVPYIVADIASATGTYDWAAAKTKAHAAVAGAVHSTMIDNVIDTGIDAVIDAAAKICQDQPGVTAALTALAKSDSGAAEAALVALVTKALPTELAGILAAA